MRGRKKEEGGETKAMTRGPRAPAQLQGSSLRTEDQEVDDFEKIHPARVAQDPHQHDTTKE